VDLLGNDAVTMALSKGLQFSAARQELIAANIANVNTPGYKRRDLDVAAFEKQMAGALGLDTDSERPRDAASALDSIEPKEARQDSLFYRPDMGGVDIDREMAELSKTSMLGAAMSQLLQKRIGAYRLVIRDGR